MFHSVYQPFMPILYLFCRSKSCRKSRMMQNEKLLQRGMERTTKYLDISRLLNQINTSISILNQPLKEDQKVKRLTRVRKDQTIDLDVSSESSDSA